MFNFRLYIIEGSKRYNHIIKGMEYFLKELLNGDYTLEIINILKKTELANKDKVFATPTLIRLNPPPVTKIVGDLSNKESLKYFLGLK